MTEQDKAGALEDFDCTLRFIELTNMSNGTTMNDFIKQKTIKTIRQVLQPSKPSTNTIRLIEQWAVDKGIMAKGTPQSQMLKMTEEVGELAKGIGANNMPEIIDAIGDCVVVLTILAKMKGLTLEECVDHAYGIISKRTGNMVNGLLVKDMQEPSETPDAEWIDNEENLPKFSDLLGLAPNATHGVPAEEFIAKIREEWDK